MEAAAGPDEAVDKLVEAATNQLKLGDTSGKRIQAHQDTKHVKVLNSTPLWPQAWRRERSRLTEQVIADVLTGLVPANLTHTKNHLDVRNENGIQTDLHGSGTESIPDSEEDLAAEEAAPPSEQPAVPKSDPAYVPVAGPFFLHDDRSALAEPSRLHTSCPE